MLRSILNSPNASVLQTDEPRNKRALGRPPFGMVSAMHRSFTRRIGHRLGGNRSRGRPHPANASNSRRLDGHRINRHEGRVQARRIPP
jgi:hypothetical protein